MIDVLNARHVGCVGLVLTFVCPAPVWAQASRGVDLIAHSAEYELKLISSEQGAEIQDVRGLFRYEISGNACDGFTVDVALQNRIVDRSGNVTQINQYSKSFEDPSLGIFSFEETQEVNGQTVERTKGAAETVDGSLRIRLTAAQSDAPQEELVQNTARFPVQFMMDTIEAARSGDVFFNRSYYDGSEGGTVAYDASGVIGRSMVAAKDAGDAFAEADLESKGWRVSLAYFKQQADAPQTDIVPDYQITFMLFENGVSSDLRIDYGDFVISGDMVEFVALPQDVCDQ